MKKNKKYSLPIAGLKPGLHQFQIEVADPFFSEQGSEDIVSGKVQADITLDKHTSMLVLDIHLSGVVTIPCDRCGDDFELPVDATQKLVVRIGGDEISDDDIITIGLHENEIDLSHQLYEYIALSVPLGRVHPVDVKGRTGCNREALHKLEQVSVKEQESEKADPRWEALKAIKI